jgi:hypothetical protein
VRFCVFTEGKIDQSAHFKSSILKPMIKDFCTRGGSMNLKYLSNEDVENGLKGLIVRERKMLHLILDYILEVERRKIHLLKGYSSLFQYLIKEMGYSAGSAQRRIEAIYLMKQTPEVGAKIEDGSLNLSQIGLLAQAVKQKQSETGEKVEVQIKSEILDKVQNLDGAATQKVIADVLDLELKAPEKKEFQKDESVHVSMTLTKEQYEKFVRCQELSAHTLEQENKSHNMVNALELVMDFYLEKKDLSFEKKSTRSKTVPEMKVLKTVTPKLKRAVFSQVSNCVFKDPVSGRVCGSTFKREIDHRQSQWAGGKNDLNNLTTLCASHNKLKYLRETFRI